MECSSCGFENREGSRFCVECGTPLAPRCPGCSAEYRPGQKFCAECGTALTGTPLPAPAPAAVRKTVTVLFADLSGSTGFGERNDAEISRQVLARYHALLQETVDAHAGTVAKFMGDGMMATWGIPEVAEDDARRAVAAGVALQQRFEDFAADVERRHGEPLALRVGINTGEVVIGEGDADLIGDALNVAARLEKACRPGYVLVGEETWRLTRADVGYEALGEVTVAGRAQPVAIYEVAAETEAEPEVAAPFVGRDAEMRRLVGVFDDARQAAKARLTTVLGSPGVGKTRLSRELCTHLAEHGDAQSVELRCDRAGEATFAPVAQLIRDASGITDDLDPDAARTAIGTLLPETEADHARVVDVLAGLVGVGPARSVEETFWGVRRLVEATAANRPLVVVIDDIQWAEPLLLDLIEHLAEWVADAAVLLVGLARPELREVRPSLAEPGRPVAAVVVLDGLDASATEALAAALLGTDRLPAGLVERLPASTDGNPLFVRELVRMLVDDRVIRRRDDGEWELTIDADAVDVPPTIQSLLGARVERLPATEREVLEYASVVGAEFSLGALRELAGERAPIASLLESMRRKELVEPTGTYWGDEPVHRFHHVLIRDAAYRRLLKTTRAELHERVAVWTDRTAADLVGEHEAATAFHYEQAFRYRTELGTGDDDTARIGRRAAELLTTAAQRALGRDDLASAGALSARALTLLPASDVAARADLLQTACECLLASGNGAAAKPLVEELGRSAGDDPRLAAWAACYAAQLVGLTDPEGLVAADAQAQAAAGALTELGDGSGQAKAHQVRAGLLARLGRVGDAELELDLALAAARAADDRRRVTAVLGAAPDAALFGPSPVARAGGRCLDVVRLLRITTASPAVEAASNRCQAVLESLRGRFDVSRSMLASARASLEELGLRHGLAQTELYAGMVEMIAGNPHDAIAPLRAAYEGLGTLGVGADAGQAAALLATALLAEGDVDEAELMAAESEALAGQNLKTAIGWRVARAEVLAARGDLSGGVALAEEAVGIAAGTDLVIDHADACVALAGLRARVGDDAGARTARADATRLYEQKGATVPAARLDEESAAVVPERPAATAPEPAAKGGHLGEANTASRVYAHVMGVIASGNDHELDHLIARGFFLDDRRHVVNYGVAELADAAAQVSWLREEGFVISPPRAVAVRGQGLALCWNDTRTQAGDDISSLTVVGTDEHDRLEVLVQFDADDFVAAQAELDARYIAGEGAEHAEMLATSTKWFRAMGDQDFDALRELVVPGFVIVDRGLLGVPELDVDGFIEWQRGFSDVQRRFLVAQLRVDGRVGQATVRIDGVDPDGGTVEWRFYVVGVSNGSGRYTRVEAFAEDDWDAAADRFEELCAATASGVAVGKELSATGQRTPLMENTATRATARFAELVSAGRVEETRELFSENHTWVDRRRTVSGPATNGYDEMIAAGVRGFAEVGFVSLAFETIAIRGDRLQLYRSVSRTADGREIAVLAITEVDATGRSPYTAWYDPDDLSTAIEELDARFVAGEAAAHAESVHLNAAWVRAMNAHDDGAMRSLAVPETVFVDHRQLGFGTLDLEGFIEWFQAYADLRLSHVTASLCVRDRVTLATNLNNAVDPDGGELVWAYHSIGVGGDDGRIERAEIFAEDEWDAAQARFEELSAATERPAPPPIENTATAVHARVIAAISSGDDAALADLVAPEFVHDDRRSVVNMGRTNRRGAAKYLPQLRAQGFEWKPPIPVAVRGERLALSRSVFRTGAGDDTSSLAVVEIDEQGRLLSLVQLDHDALDAGIEELDARYVAGEGAEREPRFEELSATTPAGPRPVLENTASRVDARVIEQFSARADRALADLIAPEFRYDDRRHVVNFGVADATEAASYVEWLREDGFEVATPQVVAVRGDRLVLSRRGRRTPAGDDLTSLAVVEVDEHGHMLALVQFDDEALDDAVAELDERYLAGEGAEHAEFLRVVIDLDRAFKVDPEGTSARFSPDFVLVDHRHLFQLEGGVQHIRDIRRSGDDAGLRSMGTINRAAFVGRSVVLVVQDAVRRAAHGGDYEWTAYLLAAFDSSLRLERLEYFAEEDWEVALTRFDELSTAPDDGRSSRVENAVTRRRAAWAEMLRSGRFDEARARLGEFTTEDVVCVDRRPTVAAPDVDGAGVVDSPQAMYELGLVEVAADPIAVRGERLALFHQVFRSPGGDELVILNLQENDASNRAVFVANYGEDQLAEAHDELNARFVAGEARAHRDLITTALAALDARQRGDFEELQRYLAADLVMNDHQQLGLGAGDLDLLLAAGRAQHSVARTAVDLVVSALVASHTLLAVQRTTRTSETGAEYLWRNCVVVSTDAAGLLDRIEWFDEADWDRALALFDELAATRTDLRTPEVVNASTRALDRMWAATLGQRFDVVASVLAPATSRDDHRKGVAGAPMRGDGEYLALLRGSFSDGQVRSVDSTPLAVRGDRLSLSSIVSDVLDFEIGFLILVELDDGGRIAAVALYDDEDLAAAQKELDARFIAGEGAPFAEILRTEVANGEAMEQRDYAALEAMAAPGMTFVDHRRLGWQSGLDQLSAMLISYDDVELSFLATKQLVGEDTVLDSIVCRGTDDRGNQAVWLWHAVCSFDREARFRSSEYFDAEDWDAALARFDELAAAPMVDPRTPEVVNGSTRTMERLLAVAAEKRFDAAAALLAPDVVRVDHRTGGISAPPMTGVAEYLELLRVSFDFDEFQHVASTPLAVRSERLSLCRIVIRAFDFEFAFVIVAELDDDGRVASVALYDEDDLATAIEELDARYVASGAATAAEVHALAALTAMNRRDWRAFTALLSPDFLAVDHSPLGFAPAGRDEFVRDQMQSLRAMVPDAVVIPIKTLASADAVLIACRTIGTTAEGNSYEWTPTFVARRDGDALVARVESFSPEQWDAALARFDEFAALPAASAAPDPPTIENLATRRAAEFMDRTNAGDSEGILALLAAGYEALDRRSVAFGPTSSGDEFSAAAADLIEVFDEIVTDEVLAIRGERLGVTRTRFVSANGFEVAMLGLGEVDEDGRVTATILFDPDDIAGAMQELDARFRAGEGAGETYVLGRTDDFGRAYAARDWEAVSALFADGAVVTDHRAIGQAWSNREDFVVSSRAVIELAPDVVHVVREVEVRNSVVLTNAEAFGTTRDGSGYAWTYRMVVAYVAGRIHRLELFDGVDESAARACFAELAAIDPRKPVADNLAVQMLTRANWLAQHGEPEAAHALTAENVVAVDRRSTVSGETTTTKAEYGRAMHLLRESFPTAIFEPLAARGDRVALFRLNMVADSGFEIPNLGVYEIDTAGLLSRVTTFDDSDLVSAIEELERRHRELRGDAYSPVERVFAEQALAANRGDLGAADAYRAVGYELVDHAPIGSGRSSSTRMMELHRAMSEQVDMVVFPARMYVSGHVGLGYFPIRGMAGDGGVYEWEFVIVKILDEAGLLAEEHLFPIEQWDEALAFFDERSAATAETPALARFEDVESAELTNRATAAGERARAASLRGDRAATIDAFAPDFRRIEGRPGAISGERVVGRDLYVDGMLAGPDAGLTHFDATTIEVVGDDHALTQVRWHNGEGSVQEWLLVGEVDGDGRLRRIANFDPEDRPAASALLHAWASGGPQNGDRMSVTAAVRNAALDRGDRDAVLATYTPDFVREDHRRGLNFGTANREETVEALLAGNVVGLGNRSSATLEVVDDAHTLVEFRMSHIDGFEVVYLLAVEADEEGRLRRAANFDLEDRERASALLREWAAGTGHEAVASTGLTNAAVRTMDHFAELFAGFDWARVGSEIYADDLTNEDRRTGVNSGVTSGRAPVLELLRALADVGFTGVDHEPLAVRGDRLALFRRTWRRPDGFDLQMLDVVGIDEEGRQTVNVLFDVSDLASSLDELERRYLAGEGAEHERFVRSVTEFWRCYNTRDRDGVRAYLADDYRLVDHRPASAGTSIGSADDFLDDMQGMIELAPDMFAFQTAYLAFGERWCLSHESVNGTSTAGAEVRLELVVVAKLVDGVFTAREVYLPEQLGEARARFDELESQG